MRRLLLPVWLILLPAPLATAAAADPPACTSERAGLVACVAGKLCACGFARGSRASGLPDGLRWNCGVLRPACGGAVPPATLDAYPYPLPPALGLGGDTHVTTVTGERNRVHNGGRR